MLVTPLVLIQIFSKRMLVDWPKCGSDPQDEGHLACLSCTSQSEARLSLVEDTILLQAGKWLPVHIQASQRSSTQQVAPKPDRINPHAQYLLPWGQIEVTSADFHSAGIQPDSKLELNSEARL